MSRRKREQFLEDISLAEFISRSYKHADFAPVKSSLLQLAVHFEDRPNKLAVHQFSFDETVDAILEKMRLIPIEDFFAHHQRLVLPFDKFWVEQTQPMYESKRRTRFGVLLQKDPAHSAIKAKFAMEAVVQPEQEEEIQHHHLVMDRFLRGQEIKYYVNATNIDMTFGERGISLDYKGATLKKMFRRAHPGVRMTAAAYKSFHDDQLKPHIDSHITFAHDIYRLLILLSSRNIHTYLPPKQSPHRGIDPIRRLYGDPKAVLPRVLTPISIDLSSEMKKALARKDKKGIRVLLGWTDVMQHRRTYHTLSGPIEKIIEDHERRIAAPVDRRGAPRNLSTSEADLGVDLSTTRPRLTHNGRPKRTWESKPS